jgi:hypothetical protein
MPKLAVFASFPRSFFALVALALLGVAACGEEGTTPKCLTENEGNCDQFPVCSKDPKNPAVCCEGADDVSSCLAGYGVPGTGGSGGGTGGTGGTGGGGSDAGTGDGG